MDFRLVEMVDQPSPIPCELEVAPFYSSDILSTLLKSPSVVKPLFVSREIDLTLVEYSQQYALKHFDRSSGMLRDASGELNVRDTAISALLWAELGQMALARRAIDAILTSQFLDPSDKTLYGNFPVHPGEVPTDSNWSAFVGSYLLVFWDRHGHELSPYLSTQVLKSIRAAAIHRTCVRHELHSSTNIKILSSFVLVRAGEVLNDKELLAAGKMLWSNLVSFTLNNGIAEYNSPNYLKVDLYGLGFLADYVRSPQIRAEAQSIRLLFWWSISQHYHISTSQLAGPYSRTYTNRMAYELTGIQPFLFRESGGAIPLKVYPDYDDNEQALHALLPVLVQPSWPKQWIGVALSSPGDERLFRERTRIVAEDGTFQQITTFFSRRLAVGSVNTDGISSSQRRAIVAHAVDSESQEIGVFLVTAPTPGAWLKSVQNKSSILAVVHFYSHKSDPAPECHLQWYGTPAALPRYMDGLSPLYGDQLNVNWMSIPVAVKVGPVLTTNSMQSSMRISFDSKDSMLDVVWRAELLQVTSTDTAADETGFAMVAFGLYFGASSAEYISLSPVAMTLTGADDIYRFSWQSPDGLLELETSVADPWFVKDFINGETIPAFPLVPD